MGILDKLNQTGTSLSYPGVTPGVAANVGATKQSKLHAFDNTPGYSINGRYNPEVTTAYTEYNDGYNNALPQPSQLDRNGNIPANQKYLNNLPK
jgi:hypothetical protein